MPFPKWGGLPEVTSKLSVDGLKPLSVVSLSAADALNNGVDDGFTEKHLKFIKDTSLLMKDTFEGIDNCLNASIAAANSNIYEDPNDDFCDEHGQTVEKAMQESKEALSKIQDSIPEEPVASSKTVDQVMQESDEALRKIQALTAKEGNQQENAPDDAALNDDATDDAATTVFPAWTQNKEGANTVFPSWVQPEDNKTTWWPSDGSAAADDMTAISPAVR